MRLFKKIKNSRLKIILAPIAIPLVFLELAIERMLDAVCLFNQKVSDDLDDVTAVIKTFERPFKLKRLVKSIRRRHPRLKIIVVDDSKSVLELEGVQTIRMPYNSGVSAGRNAGLAAVRTKYTVILDDDFIFYRHSDIYRAYLNMEANPSVDLLAGITVNLPLRTMTDFSQVPAYSLGFEPLHEPGELINGFKVLLKVSNSYIAKTEKLREVGWDDRLRRWDHADFFIRAVGVLTCVEDRVLRFLHDPTYFKLSYLRYRCDTENDYAVIVEKYPNIFG